MFYSHSLLPALPTMQLSHWQSCGRSWTVMIVAPGIRSSYRGLVRSPTGLLKVQTSIHTGLEPRRRVLVEIRTHFLGAELRLLYRSLGLRAFSRPVSRYQGFSESQDIELVEVECSVQLEIIHSCGFTAADMVCCCRNH